ncbi:MAG: hypothetical protein CL424_20320 [Acidimicrobiaceae bacterium]|nr:hypothetical protein [Acidimicrobiaceae bacterium]
MNDLDTRGRTDDLGQPIIDALAALLEAAPTPAAAPTDEHLLTALDRPNHHRIILGAAAAAVVAVGVGGLLVVNRADDPAVSNTPPQPSAPSPDRNDLADPPETSVAATPNPTESTVAQANPEADPSDELTGLFLPTYLPAGYEITNLAAYPPTTAANDNSVRWLRRDTDGRVVGEFSVTLFPPDPDSEANFEIEQNTTVHGLPAMSFDSGEGIVITWIEHDNVVSARGRNLTSDDTHTIAEAVTINPTNLGADLADPAAYGLEPMVRAEAPPTETAATNVGLTRTDGQPGGFISAATWPNTAGDTLDTLESNGNDGFERRTIAGIERLVRIQEPDRLGPFTNVQWIQDGSLITVTGRADPDEILAFAAGYEPATMTKFAQVGRDITATAADLAIMDQTTFDDGVSVSVRSLTPGSDGSGAIAMCIETPIKQCRFSFSESSLAGTFQDSVLQAFDIDGTTILIAWQDSAEAERLGEPSLSASGITRDPSQPPSPTTTATITQRITTGAGLFTEIHVPDGESPPQIDYTASNGQQTGMSTPAPGPNDF